MSAAAEPSKPNPRSAEEIRQWVANYLAKHLQVEPEKIRFDEKLMDVGLDSMQFLVLVGELEKWLGCQFVDPWIDDFTINTLAQFLAEQVAQGKTKIDPAERN
ncbi:acyl carrier protein [Bremerella cremea]|uniref:acyl carrier protein n=1 Tax=Bremerella cremea TaxID=1031537 RepID=UPI0031E716FD